jgi:hypothetical protein
MDIFQKIKELNWSKESYVVVAGGTLVALGLLDWDDDIDICVTPEIFEQCKNQGWAQEDFNGKPVLKHDIYDIGIAFGEWTLSDLQRDAMVIQDEPFISLGKLVTWKQAMGRPKDLVHIKLIEAYQKNHSI